MKKDKIKFGIPGGSLEESMVTLFQNAGYDFEIKRKPLSVCIDDDEIECFFDRANEIAFLVGQGILDGGIVSKAALAEKKPKVVKLLEIGTPSSAWEKTKVVLAVPENSRIKSLPGLQGKKIITRLPEITREFLEENKISAVIEFSPSSNEPKVPALADALVEFTNTGATLQFYNLKPIAVLLEEANILSVIANPGAAKNRAKREKMENLGMLLNGARTGQEYSGLMFHASNDMMESVFKILPALKKPTVTHLRGENWFDVFTVIKKKEIRKLIPKLKKIRCTDIIEFPLKKVII